MEPSSRPIPEDVRAQRLASLLGRRPNATAAERRFLQQLVSEGRTAPEDGHQYFMDPLTDEQIASIVIEAGHTRKWTLKPN